MQDELPNATMPRPDPHADPNERATVVALFSTLGEAERAVGALVDAGHDRERISLVASNATGEHDAYAGRDEPYDDVVDADRMGSGEGAAAGGGVGAVVGGLGGVLMGLGLLAIPGVGPALAAGPLISGLVGAGVGGAAGSILGSLVSTGVSEERAGAYAEGVRRGGTLVVVETTVGGTARAEDIMLRHGSIDIEERVTRWREAGWTRFDERAEPFTREQIEQERARFGTEPHQSGGPRR
jgi:hypothetical protein